MTTVGIKGLMFEKLLLIGVIDQQLCYCWIISKTTVS